jgi:hypothetical protein
VKGARRRYFLARVLQRERDGRIRRWRAARFRDAKSGAHPDDQQPEKLSLPLTTFVPLIQPAKETPGLAPSSKLCAACIQPDLNCSKVCSSFLVVARKGGRTSLQATQYWPDAHCHKNAAF